MFPKRNNKRFFDYESSSNTVSESVVITTLIVPNVQLSTVPTSTTTITTTTTVHPTSTTVSIIYNFKFKFTNLDYFIYYDLGQNIY